MKTATNQHHTTKAGLQINLINRSMKKFSSYLKLLGVFLVIAFSVYLILDFNNFYYFRINTKVIGHKYAYTKIDGKYQPALFSLKEKYIKTLFNVNNKLLGDSNFSSFNYITKQDLPFVEIKPFRMVDIIEYIKKDSLTYAKIKFKFISTSRPILIMHVGYIPISNLYDTIPSNSDSLKFFGMSPNY